MTALKEPRQERFARLVASGQHQVDAQKIAGYKPNISNAYNLAKRPIVAERIKELKGLPEEELKKIMGIPVKKKKVKKQSSGATRKAYVAARSAKKKINTEEYVTELYEGTVNTDLETILIVSADEITTESIRAELLINLSLSRTLGDMPSANKAVQMLAATGGMNLLSAKGYRKKPRRPKAIEGILKESEIDEETPKYRKTHKTALIDSLADEVIDTDGDSDTEKAGDTCIIDAETVENVGDNGPGESTKLSE